MSIHRREIFFVFTAIIALVAATAKGAGGGGITYQGADGPGKGKHVVFVLNGKYSSTQDLAVLAEMLAVRYGFTCTALFTTDPNTGAIVHETRDRELDNIDGLEALDHADLMVISMCARHLPDEQMKHIADYVESGRPIVGIRFANEAFLYKQVDPSPYAIYSHARRGPIWNGGFGYNVLGEDFVGHQYHSKANLQSHRCFIAIGAEEHPILRGIKDGEIWGRSDVLRVRLPMQHEVFPLLLGQVLCGANKPDDPPVGVVGEDTPKVDKDVRDRNLPMMPVAWTFPWVTSHGTTARVFNTTMGDSHDFESDAMRRLFVNACYWALEMEKQIPEKANVELVSPFGRFRDGVKPQDLAPMTERAK